MMFPFVPMILTCPPSLKHRLVRYHPLPYLLGSLHTGTMPCWYNRVMSLHGRPGRNTKNAKHGL